MLPNKVYDVLKWIALIFIPALIAFYSAIAPSVGWEVNGVVVTILGAAAAFIGALLKLSSVTYPGDATIRNVNDDPENPTAQIEWNVPLETILSKNVLLMKVDKSTPSRE